jgi:hypothetical protein
MRNLSIYLIFVLALGACTAQPDAPDLNGDAGLAQGDGGQGAGTPAWDSGPDLLADAGSTDVGELAQDIGSLAPGEYDAGFHPPEPPPPAHEQDRCAESCLGMPCGRECRRSCTLALPGIAEADQVDYLRCVHESSCEPWRCLPDREISQVCQDVCANRRLRQCSVELNADPLICGHECEGLLGMMTPPARQAWLQCSIEQCGVLPRQVNCNPQHFLGPTPSQACIDRGNTIVACERNRNRSTWEAAWECESWRSPSDQPNLGGNSLVECLAGATCAPADWYRCLIRSQEATGRAETVAEVCRNAERCEGLGTYCQMMANGFTRAIGETGLQQIHSCLRNAGEGCEDIRRCIQGVWDPNHVEVTPLCRQACIACNDATEACINTCSRLRNSLSLPQTEIYDSCLTNRAAARECGGFLPSTCISPALPAVASTCQRYIDHMSDRCPGTRFFNPTTLKAWCALSGVRTGLTDFESLSACIDRTGCAGVNAWETCTR